MAKGLGKGFAALLADTQEDYSKFSFDNLGAEGEEIKNSVIEIQIDLIDANPNQPRKIFDPTSLQELADSIAVHGVIMPIVVNRKGDKYMIIAGERRWRASKLAGRKTVPAIVKDYTERQVKEISLIENLQREDLNPIEAARAMKLLMDEYDITQEELAERIGKNRSTIANTLRLLSLESEVIDLVETGQLSQGHARALITLPKNEQIIIAKKAVMKRLSVREVEQAVKNYFHPKDEEKRRTQANMSVELKDLIVRLQRGFGTKVGAIGNDNKGRIYIDYYTRDDLDRISDILDTLENLSKKI
ncbi:MAG: ParB/RepB/Spo0J family partition protein [Clostridia bacterium]|nr:ParB/RepB/Spo0J family partition protein [Clostridia bacterium]MBQ3495905.1 ParB/RepB/Spo0J family partition protein [Clostridia bacterium]MBQ4587646.1 ParB/RepB/Spo0J family partition protein [Clostridia bacterium]MBQ6883859.1 ParB/RepB/Spo0J family partition protein [Clostridia bacterium]